MGWCTNPPAPAPVPTGPHIGLECATAVLGDLCYTHVVWAQTHGIVEHPDWYPDLTQDSSFEDFQCAVFQNEAPPPGCLPPCGVTCGGHQYACGEPGDDCLMHITWAMNEGIHAHPEWYHNLAASPLSSPRAFQCELVISLDVPVCTVTPCDYPCDGIYQPADADQGDGILNSTAIVPSGIVPLPDGDARRALQGGNKQDELGCDTFVLIVLLLIALIACAVFFSYRMRKTLIRKLQGSDLSLPVYVNQGDDESSSENPVSVIDKLQGGENAAVRKLVMGRFDKELDREARSSIMDNSKLEDLQIGEIIGRGASSVVYAATWVGQPVALKHLKLQHRGDQSVIDEFAAEIKTISKLRHPNVVGVYQTGACLLLPHRVCLVRSTLLALPRIPSA